MEIVNNKLFFGLFYFGVHMVLFADLPTFRTVINIQVVVEYFYFKFDDGYTNTSTRY